MFSLRRKIGETAVSETNGTMPVGFFLLTDRDRLIAIENVGMVGEVCIQPAPHPHEDLKPQPAVVASLERSLEENADVWAELSKY